MRYFPKSSCPMLHRSHVILDFLNDAYINSKQLELKENLPTGEEFQGDCFEKFLNSLSLAVSLANLCT